MVHFKYNGDKKEPDVEMKGGLEFAKLIRITPSGEHVPALVYESASEPKGSHKGP